MQRKLGKYDSVLFFWILLFSFFFFFHFLALDMGIRVMCRQTLDQEIKIRAKDTKKGKKYAGCSFCWFPFLVLIFQRHRAGVPGRYAIDLEKIIR